MNIKLLKSKMALNNDKQYVLATALGVSENSITHKLAGKTPFKTREIEIIATRYELTGDEIKEIFFSGGEPCEENNDSESC